MWHMLTTKEIETKLKSNISKGLSSKEALKRKKEYGDNILKEKKKESLLKRFIDQFKDFMIIILLIAAVISALMAYFEGTNEYMDSIIIIAIFTSAIASGYGFLKNVTQEKYKKTMFLICFSSILIAPLGFSKLVNLLYPIFGILGLVQIYSILKVK